MRNNLNEVVLKIGATLLRGQRMYIDTNAANKLISRYFKGEK
ncbi:MAG: hypothetical protein V4642_09420 [Bacteroidota bacterium]